MYKKFEVILGKENVLKENALKENDVIKTENKLTDNQVAKIIENNLNLRID